VIQKLLHVHKDDLGLCSTYVCCLLNLYWTSDLSRLGDVAIRMTVTTVLQIPFATRMDKPNNQVNRWTINGLRKFHFDKTSHLQGVLEVCCLLQTSSTTVGVGEESHSRERVMGAPNYMNTAP
jgi:hypothetical protein